VGASNLEQRIDDPALPLWLGKDQVKAILLQRFRRRLECWDYSFAPDQVDWSPVLALWTDGGSVRETAGRAWSSRTVPGRTPDTGAPAQAAGVGGTSVPRDASRRRSLGARNSPAPPPVGATPTRGRDPTPGARTVPVHTFD
jgi:hypothetical protein